MPYNNAAIPPPQEITGQSSLPMARVKRIISLDEDIAQCSNNAAFVISVATEMFIRYLVEQGHNVVKSERKPRRNIQYKDLANAVARIDNLEFLSDVIPKTTTYRQFKEKKARDAVNGVPKEAGQTTLDGKRSMLNGQVNGDARGIASSDIDTVMRGPEDGDIMDQARAYPSPYGQNARARDSGNHQYIDPGYGHAQHGDYGNRDGLSSNSHPNHSLTDRTVGGNHAHLNGGDITMS